MPGYPHLDYKLHIGTDCLEYLDVEDGCWYPIGEFKNDTQHFDLLEFDTDHEEAGLPEIE